MSKHFASKFPNTISVKLFQGRVYQYMLIRVIIHISVDGRWIQSEGKILYFTKTLVLGYNKQERNQPLFIYGTLTISQKEDKLNVINP